MQVNSADQPNKKLQQFLDEINELEQKYQYKLSPSISFSVDGIKPYFRVLEIVPEKGKKKNAK